MHRHAILPGSPLWDLLSRTEVTRAAYNLAVRLLSLALATEALMLFEYAVTVCRSYKLGDPATYSLSLAQALRSLSQCQSTLGLLDEPLVAVEESVNILRGLGAEQQSPHFHISQHFPWMTWGVFRKRSSGEGQKLSTAALGDPSSLYHRFFRELGAQRMR